MTLHSLVEALPHIRRDRPLTPRSWMAVPVRAIDAHAELRIYLRRRREAWRSALLALAIAGAALGSWAFLLSRLA